MSLFGFEEDLEVETTDLVPVIDNCKQCPVKTAVRQSSPVESKPTVSQIQELLVKDLLDEYAADDTLQDTNNSSSIFEETATPSTLQSGRKVRKTRKNDDESTFKTFENTNSEKITESHIQNDKTTSGIDDTVTETHEASLLRSRTKCAVARKKRENIENEHSSSSSNNTAQFEYVLKTPGTQTKSKRPAQKNCEKVKKDKLVSLINDTAQSALKVTSTRSYNKTTPRKKILQSIENTMGEDSIEATKFPKKRKNAATKKLKAKLDKNEIVEKKAEEINNQFKLVEEYQLVVE